MTVIDVGAHKGQFALYIKARLPKAEVHCFEPLPQACSRLEQLFESDSSVHVYAFGLGNKDQVSDLHVSQHDDSSSFREIGPRQVSQFPGTELAYLEKVSIKRLDDVLARETLKKPILLKIDAQGYELEVLKGSEQVLSHCSQVLVECSFVEFYVGQALFDDVYRFVVQRGFRLIGANCSAHDAAGRWLQADVLFGRQPADTQDQSV